MSRRLRKPVVMVTSLVLTIGLAIVLFIGHGKADKHVRYMMGGPEAPVGCVSCHGYLKQDNFVKRMLEEDYLSPRNMAISPEGDRVYVVAEEADALLVAETDGGVLHQIPVQRHPHSVVLSQNGQTAYVTNTWSNKVSVINLVSLQTTDLLPTGHGPTGLALGPDEKYLYVANTNSDDISVIDLEKCVETKRLVAGNDPYAVALSPDGRTLYVTNRLSNLVPYRSPLVSEVTVVDLSSQRLATRKQLQEAHLIESIAVAPNDGLALVTLVRPKNLVPTTQVDRGWMLTYGLGVLEPGPDGRILQVLLDDAGSYYADPYDVVITPDGQRAFVTHAAADVVSAIDMEALRMMLASATPDSLALFANHLGLSSRFVLKRIPTGSNPKGLALSPDGSRLYVAERFEDRLAVIDTERLETIGYIDLGGPEEVTTLRLGAQMFHKARAFQGQFSCRSCHPANDQDALSWDFGGDGLGRNVVNTMTLRDIGATAPFKWNGKNTSLYMQDGIRFAIHLTRVDPFPSKELKALVAYIIDTPQTPNRYLPPSGTLTAEQQRGKVLFERTTTNDGQHISLRGRCITCHPPPYYTIRMKMDVGTLAETDSQIPFDTPQLINISDSAPYLHDGSANTLEEIWTLNSVNDEHGVVSDLSKDQLNDLIEYLRTLGPPTKPEPDRDE